MELCNALGKLDGAQADSQAVRQEALEAVVKMLAPIIPHVCDALWRELGHDDLLLDVAWPQADDSALSRDTLTLVVQVNGKVRAKIDVPADADRDTVAEMAQSEANVLRFIDGAPIKKTIVVPGKLVNLVV